MAAEFYVPHIDPAGAAESFFHTLFIGIFNDEAARSHFGFARISPFHLRSGMPGWYLWFDGRQGAYALIVTDASAVPARSAGGEVAAAATLRIVYYPDPEEQIFSRFSWFEKIARMSHLFDESGTPTAEGQELLDEAFFTAGHLDLLVSTGNELLDLFCRAPEAWTDIRTEGLVLADPEEGPFEAVAPGVSDRAVPGWDLASFLLDKIAAGYFYLWKRSPGRVSMNLFPMPEFRVDGENRMKKTYYLGLTGYTIRLLPENAEGRLPGEQDGPADWRKALPEAVAWPDGKTMESWTQSGSGFTNLGFCDWWEIKDLPLAHSCPHLCSCYKGQEIPE
jgi:hypothetical protein